MELMRMMGNAVQVCGVVGIALSVTAACAQLPQAQNPVVLSGAVPAGWRTYQDTNYAFAIAYPEEYGIVRESTPAESGAVKRVRFLNRELLTSEFADREPARLAVEVFEWNEGDTLTGWLRSKNRLPGDAVITAARLAGAREGLRVQQRQQLAPNEFYYFAAGKYIYALTPLGGDAANMIQSFRLLVSGGKGE